MTARVIVVTVGVLALAAVGIALTLSYFSARDGSTVGGGDGPGVQRAAGVAPEVKPGNVLLLFSDERLTRDVRELALETAGPQSPALVSAGQAVLVRRQSGVRVPVRAVTSGRELEAQGPDDPALRAFIEYWLGRAAE
ncbi:MAG: hypothetical protein ACR2LK_06430 [Solirubrobacteraceae bacterium]